MPNLLELHTEETDVETQDRCHCKYTTTTTIYNDYIV